MKGVLIGVAVVVVLGAGAFLYRNNIEQPEEMYSAPVATASSTACTQDAKVCPDGSAVGRTGPNCTFATCAPPNEEITVGSTTLGYVVPSGFETAPSSGDSSVIASYQQTGTTTDAASLITVSAYPIPSGETPGQVMFEKTVFEPAGLQATSTSSFSNVSEGNNVFSAVTVADTATDVETAYYLTTPTDVYRFDIDERDVPNWNDPNLDPSTLPEHEALLQMLATLQVSSS